MTIFALSSKHLPALAAGMGLAVQHHKPAWIRAANIGNRPLPIPCSIVTPEELAEAMVRCHAGYNSAVSHYIECREGNDRLLDLE
jgi:hypothetical protein